MIGFVVYAVLVWWAAYHWRRRWRGYGASVAGVMGLVFLAFLHWKLSEWTHGRIYLPVLQVLLYPYTLLVGAGGVFMASMPKMLPFRCASCGYDLEGLEGEIAACPECGREHALDYHAGGACRGCGKTIDQRRVPAGGVVACPECGLVHFARRGVGAYGLSPSAAEEAVQGAQGEHGERKPGHDEPAQQRQAPGVDRGHHREGAGGGGLGDEVVLPA